MQAKCKRRVGARTFVLGKIDCKMVTRDKKGHYTMIKWSIHQEDITIINANALNIKESKYIKQILTDLKRKINNSR